MAFLLSVRARK